MRVYVNKFVGFCPGVRQAVEELDNLLLKTSNVVVLGDLVHNANVLDFYKQKGVVFSSDVSKVIGYDWIVIPAHGISDIKKSSLRGFVVDLTCSNVLKLRFAVKNAVEKSLDVVIFGDSSHIEISSIVEDFPDVVVTKDPLLVPFEKNFVVLSQTTMNYNNFQKFVSSLGFEKEIIVEDTICQHVRQRMDFAKILLKSCDCAVVVGSKTSSNTIRLFELCRNEIPSFMVNSLEEINEYEFVGFNSVGVFSGASTPDDLIEKIISKLKSI